MYKYDHAVTQAEEVDHPGEVLLIAVLGLDLVVGRDDGGVAGVGGRKLPELWKKIILERICEIFLFCPSLCEYEGDDQHTDTGTENTEQQLGHCGHDCG